MLGLAAILSLGCGGEPSGPTTGTIRISVSNVGNPLDLDPDGYTVAIDDGPSRPLSPDTQITIGDVGAGSHLITLGDVDSNCSVAGTNPRSVEVPSTRDAGTGVPVAFLVSCAPNIGTIQVTTTTVGDDQDSDGYTVDIGGQEKVSVQANGTISVEAVRAGSWWVSLGDVSPNCKVEGAGAANVTFGGTAQVALTVRCVPAGSLVVTTVVTGDDYSLNAATLRVIQADGIIVTDVRAPTNGSITIPLPAGEYRLLLLSVLPNCVVVPANPIVAVVLVGSSTPVTLGVACKGPRRIAFVGGSGKNADIYVLYHNGTGETRLTTTTGADLDPAWSPDGSKIAFSSERDGNFEIYSMGSRGENPVRLTQNSASDFRPAWSPDGSRIAFVSGRDGNTDIYVMNADGTNQVRLTSNPGWDTDPDWSPDGTRIAFSSQREITAIWIMNADGSDARRITSNIAGDYQPAWSPDGSRIAFMHVVNGGGRAIYFVSSDGSSIVPFVTDRGDATDPSWSSDGRNLAFATIQCGPFQWYYDTICAYSIEIIGADGTGRLAIAQSTEIYPAFVESNPAYQP